MKYDKRDKHGRPLWYDETKSKPKEQKQIKDMTKDELNDFAAKKNIDVNTEMLKKEMIDKILEEL